MNRKVTNPTPQETDIQNTKKSIVYSSAILFTIYKVWGEEAIESESCQKAVLWVRTHFLFYPDPTNLKGQNPD